MRQARKECRAEILRIEDRTLSLQQQLRAQYQDLFKKVHVCAWVGGRRAYVCYEEEDTCMSYEEEDTCMSYGLQSYASM